MRIGDGLRTNVEPAKPALANHSMHTAKLGFGDLLKGENQRMTRERLSQLLADIDRQGQLLASSRSIRDFYHYKHLVKRFMEEAVQYGLASEERREQKDRRGGKLYKLIKEVDSRLIRLAEELVSEQAPTIDLLARVDEVRGMIINFYF